ncbi:MAG TPA: CvpA family protein [Ktedonobacterales bacterium]
MLLDVLIILLVVGGVGFGFWRGILLPGLTIVGIYLGALLARFVYQSLAQSLSSVLPLNVSIAQVVIFLLIVALVPIGLAFGIRSLMGTLKLPPRLGQVDLLGGSILGGILGLVVAMLAVLAIGFLVTTADLTESGGLHYPLFDALQATWGASILRGPIVVVGHLFYYALLPNAGKTVPDILNVFIPH